HARARCGHHRRISRRSRAGRGADRHLAPGLGADGRARVAVSPPRSSSNVYLLPQPLLALPEARPRRRSLPTRLRWLVWWWRLRLTGREIIDALRRFGRPRPAMDRASFAVD